MIDEKMDETVTNEDIYKDFIEKAKVSPKHKKKDEAVQEKEEMVPLEQFNKLKEQAAACVNMMREVEFDFENYKRRTKDNFQQGVDEGIKQACSVILPALDSIKKAKKLMLDNTMLNGLLMIETNLFNALERLGVTKISTAGKFDPEIHNAVLVTVDNNRKSGDIIDELMAGFKFKDIVLRVPDVVVAK